jgi:Tfp pilus assembly pilus retraction ATPase PilT
MCTLETSLAQLVAQGQVTKEEAFLKTNNQATLNTKLSTLPGIARAVAV